MDNFIDEWLLGNDADDIQSSGGDATLDAGGHDIIAQALSDAQDAPAVRRLVLVYPWAVAATKKVEHAVLLSQVWWWTHGKKGNNGRQGMPADPTRGLHARHTARSAEEMGDAVGLTSDSADHVLCVLRESGLIWWRAKKFGAKKKRHIGLTDQARQLADNATHGRTVAYRPWLTEFAREANYDTEVSPATLGLVLSQLLYWHTRQSTGSGRSLLRRPEPEQGLPEPWFYLTNTQLAEQLGLPIARVNRAMTAAISLGLIVIKHTLRAGVKTGKVMLVSDVWTKVIKSAAGQASHMCPIEVNELTGSMLTNSPDGT